MQLGYEGAVEKPGIECVEMLRACTWDALPRSQGTQNNQTRLTQIFNAGPSRFHPKACEAGEGDPGNALGSLCV